MKIQNHVPMCVKTWHRSSIHLQTPFCYRDTVLNSKIARLPLPEQQNLDMLSTNMDGSSDCSLRSTDPPTCLRYTLLRRFPAIPWIQIRSMTRLYV